MSREGAVAIMLGVAILALLGMWWGWRRRRRRDAALSAPLGTIPEGAATLAVAHGLYVATTVHRAPLDRLLIRPLTFRSRLRITVTTAGIALDLPGAEPVFIPAAALRGAGRATWTIDRVVEPGGLPFVTWAVTGTMTADSYFRMQDGDPAVVLDAVERLLPHTEPSPTGSDS